MALWEVERGYYGRPSGTMAAERHCGWLRSTGVDQEWLGDTMRAGGAEWEVKGSIASLRSGRREATAWQQAMALWLRTTSIE